MAGLLFGVYLLPDKCSNRCGHTFILRIRHIQQAAHVSTGGNNCWGHSRSCSASKPNVGSLLGICFLLLLANAYQDFPLVHVFTFLIALCNLFEVFYELIVSLCKLVVVLLGPDLAPLLSCQFLGLFFLYYIFFTVINLCTGVGGLA